MPCIHRIETQDRRFKLPPGAGSDAVHTSPQYGYAVTLLQTEQGLTGTGLAYTLGDGTNLICDAIRLLAPPIQGKEIEELMADFGTVQRQIAEHPALRWLGPHKGVIHSALASLTNACFDLWAKSRGIPLWKLLLDLHPEALVRLIDLSYLEDVLSPQEAIALLESHRPSRPEREPVLQTGYPGYDTSVGWMEYSDEVIADNAKRALDSGFRAMKLKVGSRDTNQDIRRAHLLREIAGPGAAIMLDANQAWPLPKAIQTCLELAGMQPYWMEEPTQPDDVLAHQTLHSSRPDRRRRSRRQPRALEKLSSSRSRRNRPSRLHAPGRGQRVSRGRLTRQEVSRPRRSPRR